MTRTKKLLFGFLFLLLIFLWLTTLAKCAEGDQHVVIQVYTSPNSQDFRERPTGCGTVIGSDDKHSWILTANHVVTYDHNRRKTYPNILVKFDNGKSITADYLGGYVDADVAIIETMLGNLPFSPIAKEIPAKQTCTVVGRPWQLNGGIKVRKINHLGIPENVVGYTGDYFTGGAISGDSGGGIFDADGYVVGVISGTTGDPDYGTSGKLIGCYGKKLQEFVAHVEKKTQRCCPGGSCWQTPQYVAPQQQRPQLPPTPTLPEDNIPDLACPCGEKWVELDQWKKEIQEQIDALKEHSVLIENLNVRISDLENREPQQIDLTTIENRITNLENTDPLDLTEIYNRIEAIENSTITFQYFAGDGSIYDSETVGLNGTLSFAPIKIIKKVKVGSSVTTSETFVPIGGELILWDEFGELE